MSDKALDEVIIFLEDILSESIAPATFKVIKYHLERILKQDVKSEFNRDPKEVYTALRDVLGGEDVIEQLDLIISSYLKRRYNIIVPENKVFRLIKESDVMNLHMLAKQYLTRRSTRV